MLQTQAQAPARLSRQQPACTTRTHQPHMAAPATPRRQARSVPRPARSAGQQEASVATAAAPPPPPQQQQPQQAEGPQALHPEAFQQCVQQVQGLGFDEADAAQHVARAFGWGPKARAYWRNEKKQQPPDAQQLLAALAFLRDDLGMQQQQVAATVKAFPEVLGCAVEGRLRANVAKLQAEWRLQGEVLLKAVLRNPALLGYSLDCMGDCAGECNRCWARF